MKHECYTMSDLLDPAIKEKYITMEDKYITMEDK